MKNFISPRQIARPFVSVGLYSTQGGRHKVKTVILDTLTYQEVYDSIIGMVRLLVEKSRDNKAKHKAEQDARRKAEQEAEQQANTNQ